MVINCGDPIAALISLTSENGRARGGVILGTMSTASGYLSDFPGIQTEITYLAPGSFVNRRFVAPQREVNTGEYLSFPVTVRDARPRQADFTIASHGFELKTHRSAVRDFYDKDEVTRIYPDEVAAAVREWTGADRVHTMSWMIRTSGDLSKHARAEKDYRHSGGVQPPAAEAHCDASPDRVDAMARNYYLQRFPDAPPFKRFIYSSFWRTFSPPPQDYPLALCDGNSVGDEEGVPNTLFVVDQIPSPEEMLKPVPDEDKKIAAAIFHHNPKHRWWYFSNMTRDEVLLVVFHDSRRVRPWRVPHTAFRDTSRPDAFPRASIEFRSIAYFS
jgi:hypothetical protein